MITLTANPLPPDARYQQISCWFDRDRFRESLFEELQVTFPRRLNDAVTKRKAEFLAGRFCARSALKAWGLQPIPQVEYGDQRRPRWPDGFLGSITHSHGFASAAVARREQLLGLGIDTERLIAERTADNVTSHILTDEENGAPEQELLPSSRHYLSLIFSAKESLFKCLYPCVEHYFDFHDARIELNIDRPGEFSFRLRKTLSAQFPEGFPGRGHYALLENFVHTAVVLPR